MENAEWVDKAELLERIAGGHAALDRLLASMDEERMLRPGVYGELSVKDVLAHLAAWEGMEAGWLRASLNGERVVRFAPGFVLGEGDDDATVDATIDALNERIFNDNRGKTLSQVLADLRVAQGQLAETVGGMSEEDINDPRRFDWRHGEPVWPSIVGNSFGHYKEHIELIQKWLDRHS
jgi:hypothetical protein